MTILTRVIVALSLLTSMSPAFASDWIGTVIRPDGTAAKYRLLPVNHDANHEAIVSQRLIQDKLLGDPAPLPDEAAIPATSIPPVLDQGQRGTCAYFATVGILNSYYMSQTGFDIATGISEECLVDVRNWEFDQGTAYTGTDQPGQRPDPNGDLPNSIILTITAQGVPLAEKFGSTDCTYDGTDTNGVSLSMTDYLGAVSQSFAYGKGLSFVENTAPTVDAIRTIIASGTPVEVGIVVYNEFMNETAWVFDAKTDTADDIAGGHAVMLTGYQTDSTTGQTTFTFKNSWSTTWGNLGFGTMDGGVLTNSWSYDPSFDFIVSLPSN